jgi:hypothetical protein
MNGFLLVLLVLGALVALWVVMAYNSFVRLQGQLVPTRELFTLDSHEDIGHLVWLLDATADIARRLLTEVAEDEAAA